MAPPLHLPHASFSARVVTTRDTITIPMGARGETVHPLDPNWVRQCRWGAIAMLLASILCLAGVPFLTPSDSPLALVAVAALLGLIGVGCAHNVRMALSYIVRLNERGIAIGDARLVEWREIEGLEERLHGQRVELLSAGRERLGSIHYQIEDADFVIHTVVSRIQGRSQIVLPTDLRRPRQWVQLLNAALVILLALAAAAALDSDRTPFGGWFGAAAALACLWAVYMDLKRSLVQISLHAKHLVLRTWLESRIVERSDVREIALILKSDQGGNRSLQVVLFASDALYQVKLPGVSAFAIYQALMAWRDQGVPRAIGAP